VTSSPSCLVGGLLLGAALLLGCDASPSDAPPPERSFRGEITRLGPATDVRPALRGPSLLLQGDGPPLDTAVQAHLRHLSSRPVDVVVLAASFPAGGSETPECDRLIGQARVHSCTTITLPDPRTADADTVAATVRRAESVYFAGGNQCEYVGWDGQAVHAAVIDVYERGGGVGGGSAGLAIQGGAVYNGCTGSVRSEEALANPYDARIRVADGMFAWPSLRRVVPDSHFAKRDRMGRLIAFVARQVDERGADAFYGLGINEATAVVVGPRQTATVYGDAAYLVHADHPPETLAPNTPLTFTDLQVVRLADGDTYGLDERPLDMAYRVDVEAGTFAVDPYRAE
jgi:cyanophycinase-like exopeptidase